MNDTKRVRFWRKINHQISLVVGISMFVVMSFYGAYTFTDQLDKLKKHIYDEGMETSKILAISSASYLVANDLAGLEQMLIKSAGDIDIISIEIILNDGSVISKITHDSNVGPVVSYDYDDVKVPYEISSFANETYDSIIVWHPIVVVERLGWVKVAYSKKKIEQAVDLAWKQTLAASSVVFIVSIMLLHFLLRLHVKSIAATTRFANILGDSNGQQMKVYTESFEMESLTTALNKTSANLYHQSSEIKANREYVQLLLDAIPEAVFGIDRKSNCTFINKGCLEVLGYSDESELLGRDIVNVLTSKIEIIEKSTQNISSIKNAIHQDSHIHEKNKKFARKDGAQFPVEYWSRPIKRGNAVIGAVVTFTDITLREESLAKSKKLEKQLQQAQKMESIGQLTGGIAHDFNNILAYVLGYIELTQEIIDESGNDTIAEYLHEAHSGGVRAQELVAKMLAFGRAIDGKVESLKLELIIKEVMGLLGSIIPSSINVETDISKGLDPVLIDSIQFHQILTNLCLNAKDAMHGSGTIKINLALETINKDMLCDSCQHSFDGEYQVLRVIDSGEGMEQDTLDKIFEPFFSTKDLGKGSGMGLSMVHGLIHECKGHIRVKSTVGSGAEFQLYFPVNKQDISATHSACNVRQAM